MTLLRTPQTMIVLKDSVCITIKITETQFFSIVFKKVTMRYLRIYSGGKMTHTTGKPRLEKTRMEKKNVALQGAYL